MFEELYKIIAEFDFPCITIFHDDTAKYIKKVKQGVVLYDKKYRRVGPVNMIYHIDCFQSKRNLSTLGVKTHTKK